MCLIAFALDCHPEFRLIVAGNRDEDYRRPTAAIDWWPGQPAVVGGRDLLAGGSWMALNRDGRMAAITNFRQRPLPAVGDRPKPSRGELVGEYLTAPLRDAGDRERVIDAHRERVRSRAPDYAGFNLLMFSLDARHTRGWWLSNRAEVAEQPLAPGVHSLSNALLNTRWPKSTHLELALADTLSVADSRRIEQQLFEALADRQVPDDALLPDTGVGLDRERMLAPAFIVSDTYGTRSSTVVTIDRDDRVRYVERSFTPDGRYTQRHLSFRLQAAA